MKQKEYAPKISGFLNGRVVLRNEKKVNLSQQILVILYHSELFTN